MKRPTWTRDPAFPSLLLFAGLAVCGFVAITIGWKVASRSLIVGPQVPALVSGGLGGLVLVALGSALASVQTGRRLAASERAEIELLLDEAHALVEAKKERRP